MLERRSGVKTLTKLVLLLLLTGITSTGRKKRQIIFEDDSENQLFSSECRTPDKKSGYCMRLTSCIILLQTVNWNRLRRHFCGFEGEEPKVCCPQSDLKGTTHRPIHKTTTSTVRTISTPRTTSRTLPIPKTTVRTILTPRTTSRYRPILKNTVRTISNPRTTSRTLPILKTTVRTISTPKTTFGTLRIPNTIGTTTRSLRIPNTIGTTPRTLRVPNTIRTTPRTLRVPNTIRTTPRTLRVPNTIRTTPRTTVKITSSTTRRRQTERTTTHILKESRNGGSRNIGTTLRPRIDRKTKPPFLPQVCGISLSPQQRVVGGTVAQRGSWPWMAVISVKTSSGTIIPDCGGALITNRHVVTAPHCVVNGRRSTTLDPSRFVVRLGAYNLTIPDEPGTVDIDVEDVRRHEQFDTRTFKNDIAVLKLERTVRFTENILPVCLPYDNLREEDLTSRAAYVIGFGTTTFRGNSSDVLMQAGFYIHSQEVCKKAYDKEMQVTRVYLCAGMMDGSADACQGDSGGPLLAVGTNSYFYLVGIVSFGRQCGIPNYPGVYTRVTEFLDWLSRNLTD